jgi:hypothetical protein
MELHTTCRVEIVKGDADSLAAMSDLDPERVFMTMSFLNMRSWSRGA